MDGHSQRQTVNFPTEQALCVRTHVCVCVLEPHVSPGLGAPGGTGETGGKPTPAVARLKVSHSFSCSGWNYFSPLGISDLGGFYQNIKSIKCSIWEPAL